MRDLLIPATIVLGAGMISGSILWTASLPPRTPAESSVSPIAPPPDRAAISVPAPAESTPIVPIVDVGKVKLTGEPFLGDPNAKAVMVLWFDYQCPFCRQVEQTVLPQLVADYVDTGKLRIYFKDFAFLGPDSLTAALASRAVWDAAPKAFFAWHSAVFAHQDGENRGWGNAEDIAAVTKSLPAIDGPAVEKTLKENASTYQQAIADDLAEGEAMGIEGTPGVIIGDQLISGAQPYSVFKAAVDRMLATGGTP